jgi:hypothetical protein
MNRQTISRLLAAIVTSVLLAASPLFAQTSPKAAVPPEVRVTLSRGSYTGMLVSLTATEVVFRQKNSANDIRYPLSVVRRIETVHHNARNMAIVGGGVGFLIALASDLCGSGRPYAAAGATGEPDCITAKPLLIPAALAGLGAFIGNGIDNERKRVLYPTSSPKPIVRVAPLTLRKGAGAIMTVRW